MQDNQIHSITHASDFTTIIMQGGKEFYIKDKLHELFDTIAESQLINIIEKEGSDY